MWPSDLNCPNNTTAHFQSHNIAVLKDFFERSYAKFRMKLWTMSQREQRDLLLTNEGLLYRNKCHKMAEATCGPWTWIVQITQLHFSGLIIPLCWRTLLNGVTQILYWSYEQCRRENKRLCCQCTKGYFMQTNVCNRHKLCTMCINLHIPRAA